MQPPVFENETERLQELYSYHILDTQPEAEYEDIVFLASEICDCPIALVSLVDADRQWFKARVGWSPQETPRETGFCAHAIVQPDLFVVPDAAADSRFAGSPLVCGEPFVRFYAGMPLITENGLALGTVCILAGEPRVLTTQQEEALRLLARQTIRFLEKRKSAATLEETLVESAEREKILRENEEFKTRIIECSTDCIKILDTGGRLLSMNAGGMSVLEICDFAPLVHSSWVDFWQGSDRDAARKAVEDAAAGKLGRFTGFFPTMQHRKPMWWDVVVSPILDSDGKPARLIAVSRDITEQHQAEQTLSAITEGTASVTGMDFFRALTRSLTAALGMQYAFIAECTDLSNTEVRTLAYWAGEDFVDNVTFPLKGTPCEKVIGGEVCFYPCNTWRLFPEDRPLGVLGIESYLGVPIRASSGRILGHIAVLHVREAELKQHEVSILKTFAVRAAAELERKRSEEELQKAYSDLEVLKNKLHAEKTYLQEEINTRHIFSEIIGNSPRMRKVFENMARVAATNSTVLVYGETGTGKELIARAIHNESKRKERTLVSVNCAALTAGLIESELFGHEKGAFTGATARRRGRFELADGGTIFLDEVSEIPLETQTKLLRVLQEQEIERVGGTETIRVNVRVIAATNKDLAALVRQGAFRSDLFYRLEIFPISLPPLRERREDIPLLTRYFVHRLSSRIGKRIEGVSEEAQDQLLAYDWPGNVRELANVLERATILCEGRVLQREHIGVLTPEAPKEQDGVLTLEETERRHILKALEQTGWVVGGRQGAARLLGINRTTLIARMKRMGIQRETHSG